MSDEIEIVESPAKSRVSRRNALKAGVAVGVGTAVWSGVSITSLGGTPAYAAGCTFVERIPLINVPCRNVDIRSDCTATPTAFAYHTLDAVLPAGFFIDNNIGNAGTCCPVPTASRPVFRWDGSHPNVTCTVAIVFFTSNCTGGGTIYETVVTNPPGVGGPTGGQVSINMPCPVTVAPGPFQNDFYSIQAFCAPNNAPPGCVQNPPF